MDPFDTFEHDHVFWIFPHSSMREYFEKYLNQNEIIVCKTIGEIRVQFPSMFLLNPREFDPQGTISRQKKDNRKGILAGSQMGQPVNIHGWQWAQPGLSADTSQNQKKTIS